MNLRRYLGRVAAACLALAGSAPALAQSGANGKALLEEARAPSQHYDR